MLCLNEKQHRGLLTHSACNFTIYLPDYYKRIFGTDNLIDMDTFKRD